MGEGRSNFTRSFTSIESHHIREIEREPNGYGRNEGKTRDLEARESVRTPIKPFKCSFSRLDFPIFPVNQRPAPEEFKCFLSVTVSVKLPQHFVNTVLKKQK